MEDSFDENPLNHGEFAVQNTSEDASESKVSACQLGYFEDDALTHMVKRHSRRSPLINRGYYARVAAVRMVTRRFLDCVPKDVKFQVVNLGAGLDTFYWWLKKEEREFLYYEVDFPEILARKTNNIMKKESLWKVIAKDAKDRFGVPTSKKEGIRVIDAPDYKMIPTDMRNIETLVSLSKEAGMCSDMPTLFVAECVLVYLQSFQSDAVIRWAKEVVDASKAPSALVVYEQIHPNDAFGKTMVHNLQTRGCPLLGIHEYPTVEAQIDRYKNLGWDDVSVVDMNEVYDQHLDRQDVLRVTRLELFDEFEEWRLIQAHYMVALATRNMQNEHDYMRPLQGLWEETRKSAEAFHAETHTLPEFLEMGSSVSITTVPSPKMSSATLSPSQLLHDLPMHVETDSLRRPSVGVGTPAHPKWGCIK